MRRSPQGSAGRTRAPQFESGSFGTDLGPAGPTWPRRTNQDTGTDRAPRDEPGAPQNKSEPVGHYQGPSGRTRAPLTNQGPKGQIRTPRDRVGPHGTEQGPAGRISALHMGPARAPQDE